MNSRLRKVRAATALLLAIPAIATAHHSRSHYPDRVQELEGELVAVHWTNPHVGFTVKVVNEAGQPEEWRVEGLSNLAGMNKGGVTRDVFRIGEHVKFAGSESTLRPRDMLATNLLLENGTEVLLVVNGELYWGEQSAERYAPSLTTTGPVDAASENLGIFRVWSNVPGGAGQRTQFLFTAEAIAARAEWNPIDNFAERCEPEGMPRIMRNPHPFEFVNNGTEISLISELYDLVRTIHIDRSAAPVDEPPSPLGYSIGSWDGPTLVVTTTGINWSYFDNIGTPQSEDVEIVERFTLSEDQTRLDYRFTVTDPTTFSEPAVYERYWLALGEAIEHYDCRVY